MSIEIDHEQERNSINLQFPSGRSDPLDDASTPDNTIAIENISENFLKIWSSLPNAVRLHPSTAFMQKEYERSRSIVPDSNIPRTNNLSQNLSQHPQRKRRNEEDCNESHDLSKNYNSNKRRLILIAQYIKVLSLVTCWIMFFIALVIKTEKVDLVHQIALEHEQTTSLTLANSKWNDRISVIIESPLLQSKKNPANNTDPVYYVSLWFELLNLENVVQNISTAWIVPLFPPNPSSEISSSQKEENIFFLNLPESLNQHSLLLKLKTNVKTAVPLIISYDQSPIDTKKVMIYGALLLVGLYILLIFEIINKTLAAVIASTSSLAVLAILNQRPMMSEIISWIDIDTLLLLFSMMMLVTVVSNTGIFDFLAVYAYKITKGAVWPMLCTLWFSTAIISALLDNVTVILLVTPMAIRLCNVMGLKPVPVLTAMVIFSNIGGGMTPIGDPPNVIIASHHDIVKAGIDFGTFTAHMSIGVILVFIVMYGQFSFIFRDLDQLRVKKSENAEDLENEIIRWRNLAGTLPNNSRDENLVKKTVMIRLEELSIESKKKLSAQIEQKDYLTTLKELQEKFPIKNKWLLVKCAFSMSLVLVLFFFHSTPQYNLSLGWTAFLGVLLLAILADSEDFEGIITKVEWSTLLFFAALFVMMEVLTKLGLINWIGKQVEILVLTVSEEYRLAIAILLMLWVSAIMGAFFDNVPLTTILIRIALGLAENKTLNLPLQPLIWALAFGACMGGNGTLIGATVNVVCAGVAEQHGHHITFMKFFKMGFPALITSNLTISAYLLIAHVVFSWHF